MKLSIQNNFQVSGLENWMIIVVIDGDGEFWVLGGGFWWDKTEIEYKGENIHNLEM